MSKPLILVSVLVLAICGAALAVYGFWRIKNVAIQPIGAKNCAVELEKRITRGDSLSGIIEPGEEVILARNFYQCRDIFRGDVVAYSYAGNAAPIIKVVRGVSGDNFGVRKRAGRWEILINRETLLTSRGEPFSVDQRARDLIQGYVDSYGGVIPKDTVFLLGNHASGTLDSTRFGLVHQSDIIGKIIYNASN